MADMTKREKLVQIIADAEDLDSAVDAILAELREPDDRMRRVAAAYLGFNPDEPVGQAEAVRVSLWQAMLDAAK